MAEAEGRDSVFTTDIFESPDPVMPGFFQLPEPANSLFSINQIESGFLSFASERV